GGGVVHDSTAAEEYAECLLKAEYFNRTRRPLGLLETLRFAPRDGLIRADQHLARLERSARRFGIPIHAAAARRSLNQCVSDCGSDARVRLRLEESGSVNVAVDQLAQIEQRAWRVAISPIRVSSHDALAKHKTDWRSLYDDERARLQETFGCDEVLFLNERG